MQCETANTTELEEPAKREVEDETILIPAPFKDIMEETTRMPEETHSTAGEEIHGKSDNPDDRADIRQRAREDAANKLDTDHLAKSSQLDETREKTTCISAAAEKTKQRRTPSLAGSITEKLNIKNPRAGLKVVEEQRKIPELIANCNTTKVLKNPKKAHQLEEHPEEEVGERWQNGETRSNPWGNDEETMKEAWRTLRATHRARGGWELPREPPRELPRQPPSATEPTREVARETSGDPKDVPMEQENPTTGTKMITLCAPGYTGKTMPTKESPKTAEPLREASRELPRKQPKAKMEKANNLTTTLREENPKAVDQDTCTCPWVN